MILRSFFIRIRAFQRRLRRPPLKCWHISTIALTGCRVLQQTSEYVRKNTSMPIIIYFDWSVDAQDHFQSLGTAISPLDGYRNLLRWLDLIAQPANRERLGSVQSQRLAADAVGKLQW